MSNSAPILRNVNPNSFITSDHHFGHRNISTLCNRPLPGAEMDEEMVRRWNSVVKEGDTVFHLGDFSLSLKDARKWAPRLNGNIVLVAGNHDECWTHHNRITTDEKRQNKIMGYMELFDFVVPEGQLLVEVGPETVLLSHLPRIGDSQAEDRYASVRPTDEWHPILCGHVHNTWSGDGRVYKGQVNVGVDVWGFYPIRLWEALKESVYSTLLSEGMLNIEGDKDKE